MVEKLNSSLVNGDFSFTNDLKVQKYPGDLPERVIQFVEENFSKSSC
ncbi:hypothetical protein [Pelosinus propionicus]|uniref:Tagaturonate reductase n=1 Tax=Pelosinus propionicus DSM 13327 TaxID=1123291 RepID=A0A1I4MEU3_9FIRM|nr:hypothetical protein [Pelosinus propionicus]SFM01741.1 tagaturonate reductase [Pelosinus propionicus DSM 13327]